MLTLEKYIEAFAQEVYPIFVAKNWQWATSEGTMVVPQPQDIERMIRGLIITLKTDKGSAFVSSGRITVCRVCEPIGYLLSLELVSPFRG